MSFTSNNLRFLRKKFGYTQDRFAEAVGIKRSSLGAYEEGRAEVKQEVLEVMANLFGVTAYDLKNTNLTQVISNVPNRVAPPTTPPDPRPLTPQPFANIPTANPSAGQGTPFQTNAPFSNLFETPRVIEPAPQPSTNNPVAGYQAPITPNPVVEELKKQAQDETKKPETEPAAPKKQSPKIDHDFLTGRECRYLAYTANENGKPLLNMVTAEQSKDYLKSLNDVKFLSGLETLSFPWAQEGAFYRAFELPTEAQFWVIGKFCRNWITLAEMSKFVVVTNKGLQYGILEKTDHKEGITLQIGANTKQISWESILEIWQQEAVISPEKAGENSALQRIMGKLTDLQTEIAALQK